MNPKQNNMDRYKQCITPFWRLWSLSVIQHIEAEIKWPSFSRRYFNWILLTENVWISIEISLNKIPKGPINNILALVKIKAFLRETFLLPWNKNENTEMIQQNTHTIISLPRGWTPPGVLIPLSFTFQKQHNMWNRNKCFMVQNKAF